MLIDIEPKDTSDDPLLAMIAGTYGRSARPERLAQGVYTVGHWNFDECFPQGVYFNEYPDIRTDNDRLCPYGVCDSLEQFLATDLGALIQASERRFVVSLVKLRRDEQPPDGGWRWHKWGPYIGLQEPQCEYLHDEPMIEEVWTYHVYEVISESEEP